MSLMTSLHGFASKATLRHQGWGMYPWVYTEERIGLSMREDIGQIGLV